MKIVHAKGAMLVGVGICGACSLSTICFGAYSFYEGDIKGGTGFMIISIVLIMIGIITGLSIYCTHWIKYGNKSVIIKRVSKKSVNDRPIGKWEKREDEFLLEELVAYGLSRGILPHSVEFHRSSGGTLETECFFRLKNGEMIGYEVGYYMPKDIDAFYRYIFEETGLEFQANNKKFNNERYKCNIRAGKIYTEQSDE